MNLFKQIKFWNNADRIGPDMLSTYWRIFFKSQMLKLCKKKFLYFDETASIRPGAYIVGCSKISIGKRCVIRPGCMFHGTSDNLTISIDIRDDVLLGSGCHIYVSNHNFNDHNIPIIDQGHSPSQVVIIHKGAWLGSNVIILPGCTIGENAVIAAGSVVTKSIPSRVLAAGVPAKILRTI